jgi:subtilisin family serine protease
LFSYNTFSQENQAKLLNQNSIISLNEVFADKVFLRNFKSADSEEDFRVLFEPKDSKYLSYLDHLGNNLWVFDSYPGVAITLTKIEMLELIKRDVIRNLWHNSIISASSDLTHFQTLNLTRDVYDYTASIDAPNFWNEGYYGNSTRVAILDTGIKQNHPALNQSMVGENRIIAAKNFFDDSSNVEDNNGHGTEVAGIIGSNGLFGFDKGVAPNCEFLIGKILSSTAQGSVETLIKGIDWALEYEADVINLSLGKAVSNITSPEVIAVNTAVQQGVVVCVAAGNARNSIELGYNDLFTILSPGVASNAITIGALDNNLVLYEKSSAGSAIKNYEEMNGQFLYDSVEISNTLLKPDLLAPGVMLNTTSKEGLTTKRVSGTSYSTAVVSGMCSLLLHKHQNTPPSILKASLLATANKQYVEMTSPFGSIIRRMIPKLYQGSGLINGPSASDYLKDVPPIFIWPSTVPYDLNTVFKNSESLFQISLFINEEAENVLVSMQSSVEKTVSIDGIPEEPDVGQYQLHIKISHEDAYTGTHGHSVNFAVNNQTETLRLSYDVIKAKGRILIICDELGTIGKFTLHGSLWNLLTISKEIGLIPSLLPRDSLSKISSLNLNDYEVIALVNPNSSEFRSYTEEDLSILLDYMTRNGNYNGGAIILLPSINSDLALINSLTHTFNISYSLTGLTNELLDVSTFDHSILENPYLITDLLLPNPLNITKEDDPLNSIKERFAISDQRDDNGSLIIAANSVDMFLSSPYLYSDVSSDYEEIMQSMHFGDNEEFLRNLFSSTVVDEVNIDYSVNTKELKENDLLKVKINAHNFYKPLSGIDFYLSLETSLISVFQTSIYSDCQNGSYSFSFRPETFKIPPGRYSLVVRSYFGKVSWSFHLLAKVSWGPIIVELSVIACIALLIVTKQKQVKK